MHGACDLYLYRKHKLSHLDIGKVLLASMLKHQQYKSAKKWTENRLHSIQKPLNSFGKEKKRQRKLRYASRM